MNQYNNPYPSPELEAIYPFEELDFQRYSEREMLQRGREFHDLAEKRRSVRMFSDNPVPRVLIEQAIATASTAPSGAHKQPWHFVAIANAGIKQTIRAAAEEEERVNYVENRMNEEWQAALAPLGTDHHKEFLELAPWIVVLFEQRFEQTAEGPKKNYYVKESVGMAAGLFITALHNMGLATLPHTPSPMAFLRQVLQRPENERPFVLFPVGYPSEVTKVPVLSRKSLSAITTFLD